MTVHSPLLKDISVGKGRYSYQTHASLVGMVYTLKDERQGPRQSEEIGRNAGAVFLDA